MTIWPSPTMSPLSKAPRTEDKRRWRFQRSEIALGAVKYTFGM